MRRWQLLVALLAVFTLIAAACGDDDTSSSTDGTATDDSATDDSATDDSAADDSAADDSAGGDIAVDFGATEDTIRVGLNADLSGIFAPLVTQIVDAQEVYWDKVNAEGGIGGKQVEVVILDNAYDVPTHLENYEELRAEDETGVAIISQSTGSPHTTATAESLVQDNLIAIPLSWYSGWPDPTLGQNVFEAYTNYCLESINGVTYMSEQHGNNVAIVSFPGEYGQDGATGAKLAAEALGLNVVYDGEGVVIPGEDQTAVISEIVDSGADFVWVTINPTTLAEIMGGAAAQGFTGQWSGNSPSYSFLLLDTELAPVLDTNYTHSTYTQLWNTGDVPGMAEVVDAMTEARPDAVVSDVYIVGWTEGQITKAILDQAAANGDMTRAGIVAAANEVSVDFGGLAPSQTWAGEPNDFIVRESYLYDIDASLYNSGATLAEGGGTGFSLLEGPYVSPTAEAYDFQGPCFVPEG